MKRILGILIIFFISCSEEEVEISEISIAKDNLIVDTHIDVPYRLWMQDSVGDQIDDISRLTPGDFDYERAVEGGLNIPFFSIYLPAETEDLGTSFKMANQLIDMIEDIISQDQEKFFLIRSVKDAFSFPKNKLIGIALGMENGSPLEGDLSRVQYFYDRGIRYITLTHSKSNHISDSSYDDNIQWGGLSEFGKKLVKEMNRVGIMIDISHVNDEAFYQAISISKVPVIASHSSLRYFTPGFERNVSDDMLIKLADKGGVIHINFGSSFVSQNSREYGNKLQGYILENLAKEKKDMVKTDSPEDQVSFFRKEYLSSNPYPYASIDDVIDHIDRVVQLVGIDHVGIGSDFDGVGDTLPVDLKDVSMYPNLVTGLLKRGYNQLEIKKILSENTLRVWREAETYAESH